jgi:flagellar hook protein FlgE
MLTSLYTGTAGIKANSRALGTVGSNIANVSTVGYKASRSAFSNVLNESMAIGTVGEEEIWTQGSLEQTENTTDFAVVGEGMFKLRDEAGAMFYSRDGAFHFDETGKLVNTGGLAVQGFAINPRGQLEGAGNILVNSVNSAPAATEEIGVNFNLDGEYTAATAVVDCTENLSSVNFTALSAGPNGNDISISYTKTPGQGPMDVAANGNAITVSIGDSKATAAQVAAMVNAYFEGAARKEVGSGDAAVLYVAATPGDAGNNISVEYVGPVAASLTTGTGDAAVTVTADTVGTTGNNITVTYAAGSGNNVALSAALSGNDITVTLGTDGSGSLDATKNTAALVAAAINGAAGSLITASAGGDGSGAVTAAAQTSLSGGLLSLDSELAVSVTGNAITVSLGTSSGEIVSNAQEVAQAVNAHAVAGAMVISYASGNGSGAVSATSVAAELVSGDDTTLVSQQLDGGATATQGSGGEAVLFAADRAGTEGNGIEVVYVDPGAEGTLSVEVSGDTITVTLASDGTEITSTAKDVADAINSSAEAAAKITAYAGGTDTITTTGTVTLAGGDTNPLTSVVRAEAGGNGSGLVEARDPIVLNGGEEPDDFSTTTTVYDSLGNPVDLTIDFVFDPVTSYNPDEGIVEKISQWTWIARSSEGVASAHGTLRFDSTGQLDRINSKWDTGVMTEPPNPQYTLRDDGNPTIGITDLSSGASDISMVWDLTNSTLITGFSADSEIRSQTQDGHPPGTLREISVDGEGVVWGSFSNGQSQALYQVGLAVFSNYNGLSSQGSNVFAETVESGVGLFGVASTGGRGNISPGSLELSNVDLAEEFVRMITIQRAYQANSKVITTSADVLQELVNMKR